LPKPFQSQPVAFGWHSSSSQLASASSSVGRSGSSRDAVIVFAGGPGARVVAA
jgi:hypothetical protein